MLLYRILYHVLRTSILFWLWSLGILLHLRFRVPVLAPTSGAVPRSTLPALSVVLPLRDEERNVRDCLSSLLAQDYPQLDVIVLDDCSRDRTGSIAREVARRDPRARVFTGSRRRGAGSARAGQIIRASVTLMVNGCCSPMPTSGCTRRPLHRPSPPRRRRMRMWSASCSTWSVAASGKACCSPRSRSSFLRCDRRCS